MSKATGGCEFSCLLFTRMYQTSRTFCLSPRESVPGASRSKLAPAFMSPAQKSEWQTYVACLTLVSGERPSQHSCPVSCPSGSPATRMGSEQKLVRKDSSGLYLHLLDLGAWLSGCGAYRCLSMLPENCPEPPAGKPASSSLTQRP